MGGKGSGRQPGDGPQTRKQMSLVCGTGAPDKPKGLSPDVSAAWDWIERVTAGVVFEQDTLTILQAAQTWARHQELERMVTEAAGTPTLYLELSRLQLATGRQLNAVFDRLFLNPKSRQTARVPRESVAERDELEMLMDD